jgi:hypothetical protein
MAGIRKKEWTTKKGVNKYCWEITYYIDGKLFRKAGFKTRQEAQEAMPKVTKSFDSKMAFSELAEDYLERHCSLQCKESTKNLYESYLKVNLVKIKR